MQYDLVFDAAQQPLEWRWPAFGLIFVAVGFAMWKGEGAVQRRAKTKTSLFTRFFFGFSILWTVLTTAAMLGGYWRVRNALEHGRYREVEGVVENFDSMPYEGHKKESFTVRGQKFAYSDYEITPYSKGDTLSSDQL
jgi:hypothetical protein